MRKRKLIEIEEKLRELEYRTFTPLEAITSGRIYVEEDGSFYLRGKYYKVIIKEVK